MAKSPKSPRGALRDQRTPAARARQRRIIEAAAQVFHRRGYGAASVQEVADTSGILKGSLYHYISSKEDLLYHLLLETNETALSLIDEIAESGEPALRQLHEFMRCYTAYNCRNHVKVSVYYRDLALVSKDRYKTILAQRARFDEYVLGLIEDAKKDGSIPTEIDTRLASMFVFGVCNWVYTWFTEKGPATAKEIGAMFADLAVTALTQGRTFELPPSAIE